MYGFYLSHKHNYVAVITTKWIGIACARLPTQRGRGVWYSCVNHCRLRNFRGWIWLAQCYLTALWYFTGGLVGKVKRQW